MGPPQFTVFYCRQNLTAHGQAVDIDSSYELPLPRGSDIFRGHTSLRVRYYPSVITERMPKTPEYSESPLPSVYFQTFRTLSLAERHACPLASSSVRL